MGWRIPTKWRTLMGWAEHHSAIVLVVPLGDNPSIYYGDSQEALYALESLKSWLDPLIDEMRVDAEMKTYMEP